MNNITYITYQKFPAYTANSLQTITNLKYFVKYGLKTKLIFPLRGKDATSDISKLKKFYDFEENFEIRGTKHYLPFQRVSFLNAFFFLISHFFWSAFISTRIDNYTNKSSIIFTRSEWIFYFLSLKKRRVVYECHQLSKLKKIIIPKALKSKNSKVIFLNENIKKDLNLVNELSNRTIVIHNGVDEELFLKTDKKKEENKIIFVGNLERFNKPRDLNFVIESFKEKLIDEKYTFSIIGGPTKKADELRSYINDNQLQNSITVHGPMSHKDTIDFIKSSDLGLLINSSDNLHSYSFTSPLKYFEYLYGECKILAVDFPAHNTLPFSENISFFKENDQISFIDALNKCDHIKRLKRDNLKNITMTSRVEKIIEFIF